MILSPSAGEVSSQNDMSITGRRRRVLGAYVSMVLAVTIVYKTPSSQVGSNPIHGYFVHNYFYSQLLSTEVECASPTGRKYNERTSEILVLLSGKRNQNGDLHTFIFLTANLIHL
jgi:hypothetical protein